MQSFGRDLGIQDINPDRIKFADEKITSAKPFRNARTTLNPDEIANKRESIRTLGILKKPIVRPIESNGDGFTHEIVAGSLRMRCVHKLRDENALCYNAVTCEWVPAQQLYATVQCQVRECDEDTAIRISIAENLEHSAVPELDLMEYCKELTELMIDGKPKYERKEIAGMCNRSESWVSLTLKLDGLAAPYKKLMYDGRLARTGAIALVLGAKEQHFDRIIEECKDEVREEAEEEKEVAEGEYKQALADVEDAEIDCAIYEKRKDEESLAAAKKRHVAARKRVSVASDKRKAAETKAESGVITADTVNKVILRTPGAKKGKPKPLTPKSLRELHEQYTKVELGDGIRLPGNVAIAVMDVVLGKRSVVGLDMLIEEVRQGMLDQETDTETEPVTEEIACVEA